MIVVIERNGGYLTPGYKRSFYTHKPLTLYHFEKIKSLSPEAFIDKLQRDFPHLKKIIVGYDFHFGNGKAGNAKYLQKIFHGEVIIIDQISIESIPVHSRTIKKLLKENNISLVNKLLGRSYQIDGDVISGQGLGSKVLVPTLNLHVDHYQLPCKGVYATYTKISNTWLPSITFLGHRVTTDGKFAVETHILQREIPTPPSGTLWIRFEQFIRQNRKFDSFEALKSEIIKNIQEAKKILQ